MPDINLLNGQLEVIENPGLDTLDPRFGEITTLLQQENFDEIVKQAEELYAQNIYDLRIIGYYFYALFLEQEIQGLSEILPCLLKLTAENWDAVGPSKKKEKHFKRSIKWLFDRVLKIITRHKEKSDDTWQQWLTVISSDTIFVLLESIESLKRFAGQVLEDSTSIDLLSKLEGCINEIHAIVYEQEQSTQAAQEEEIAQEEEESQEVQQNEPQQSGNVSQVVQQTVVAPQNQGTLVEGSYHLQVFLKKLEAFQTLVTKGDIAKASIIADDINEIIENFDPRTYFPKLFSNYYKVLTQSIEEVAGFWENKDTLTWNNMKELYKADIETFIDF